MSTQSLKWLGTAVRFRSICVTRPATAELSSGNHSNFVYKQYISNMAHPEGTLGPKVLTAGSPLPPLKDGVMRLYSMRFCPFAHRARLILANKEMAYETVNIHLSKKPEWFVNKSPNQEVPAVEHDGRIVYDSLVTAEYLDSLLKSKKGDKPLVSTDPYRKAHDSLLITYNGTKLVPNYYKIINTKGEDEDIIYDFMTAMEKLETTLKERASNFFAGDKPGYVDYMIWPWQERFFLFKKYPKVDITMNKFPLLKQWQGRMMEDPAVKKCAQTVQRHDDFIVSWKNGDENPYDVGVDDKVDFPAYK